MAVGETSPGDAGADTAPPLHVLWLSAGLGCDGESVAITSATRPSFEDLLHGRLPGCPPIALHLPLLAVETGEEHMRHYTDAEEGRLGPFVLVVEGAVGNELANGEGYWSGFGVNPFNGQPITVNEWIDRLAPLAAAVVAIGTCATYGGVPAMRGNPTGAMGVPDHLGWSWRARTGLPIVCIPGCPAQPDNMTETLAAVAAFAAGTGPAPELDEQLRPAWLFARTTREGCSRAGFTEQGRFATTYGDDPRCLVKLGCKGPVARCNVPTRGWINGIGGCPNAGGICIGCTMPGFPDRYQPFMGNDRWGAMAADFQRFTYGPIFRYLRKRNLRVHYDREPAWRRPGKDIDTDPVPRPGGARW